MDALFELRNDRFHPTRWARGPWDIRFLHGGPPAALLTHLIELRCPDRGWIPGRITFDLLRPVPVRPLEGRSRVVREGRRIRIIDAELFDGETLVSRAMALVLRQTAQPDARVTLASGDPIPDWRGLEEYPWGDVGEPVEEVFHRGCRRRPVRWRRGETVRTWALAPFDLLPGRALSPLQHAAALADFSNAVGSSSSAATGPLINADITLSVFRQPLGEWLFMEVAARGDQHGVAVSSVHLHDEQGFFGHSAASCIANG